ncbi:hypothetical protein D5086_021271 [Populus alba]|uniref:Uncharacterized protein n=2 Tax=Populus alba TaxID=43335 RepID=A0ACC4BDG6_POPAL
MDQVMKVAPSLSGPLLRMHFHDCFVRGCEGSVLLNSSTGQAEKDSPPNLSLRGYQIIDRVKTALEKECPGVVSCADILAIVARDVTVATMGPFWEVETGRRDGRVSTFSEPLTNLPPFFANISQLISMFRSKGLSVKDLVVLSGGHTIGTSHCSSFSSRLYNSTGKDGTDPTLDSEYIEKLKNKCKSDAALLDNSETKAYVKLQSAATYRSTFFKDFGVSMINMGRVEVLTGKAGEIRKVCSKVN